jgi:asparagine synthase (glutamine-hydrolysing)
LLDQVVAEHLIADVPVGLLLSGGLDSSLVAALAARHGPITTVCMGFAESGVDERPEAQRVAAHIGSRHLEVLISASEVRAEIETGAWVFDDLFADWGTITTRILYRRCRELGLKVVLVGEGSDELFGGYEVFRQPVQGELGLWRLYQRYAGRRWGRLYPSFRRIMRGYLERHAGEAFSAIRDFEARHQLPNQYVMKVDKASMAESVEARAPYLDRRVAEFAWATPQQQLLVEGENKHLLREVARRDRLLPEAISGRPKFGAPLASDWMDSHAEFRAFARETILAHDGQTARLGLLPAMRDYFEHGRSGQPWPGALSIYRNMAWRLLLLELWAEHYGVQ